ncbi:MAG TPA: DegV family protein [Jatrophihabitans sp.]|nr:DegV family protein [Jatrophihabitans sp.]
MSPPEPPDRPARVTVVTDSTSYLPPGLADRLGVRVVPLQVQLGDRTGREGIDVAPQDVTDALRNRQPVSTSRPTPGDFGKLYREILDQGSERVLSIHLSAELSGTCDSARLAAGELDAGLVRVLDSRSACMALGFGVLAAARSAASGADLAEAERVARATLRSTTALFYVDSLEWLHRGGRIGTAAARFGTALAVKPLLHLSDGRIAPLEKVRTASKAIARLVQLGVTAAGSHPVDVAVQHLAAPDRAADLVRQLRAALPGLRELYESEVGAAVGAHVGPGLLGIVVSRASGPAAD